MSLLKIILRNRDIQKVFNHVIHGRGKSFDCFSQGMSKKMLMSTPSKCNYFKNHKILYEKYYKGNEIKSRMTSSRIGCLLKNNHTLKVPVLIGAAAIGGSSKPEDSNYWLKIMKDSVKNSMILHAATDDDIPDINELAKDISEAGLRKIDEAQKILQQKLKKLRNDIEDSPDGLIKELLQLYLTALEAAVEILGNFEKDVVRELVNEKKRK